MTDTAYYPVFDSVKATTHLNEEQYMKMYKRSLEDPDGFWDEQANLNLDWYQKWHTVSQYDFDTANIKWFEGGKLNVSVNCIDRHLANRADQTAIIWEGDNPNQSQNITYQELHDRVCQLANAMRSKGVGKGDRVCLYMPMIPEAVYAMLACTRIGVTRGLTWSY